MSQYGQSLMQELERLRIGPGMGYFGFVGSAPLWGEASKGNWTKEVSQWAGVLKRGWPEAWICRWDLSWAWALSNGQCFNHQGQHIHCKDYIQQCVVETGHATLYATSNQVSMTVITLQAAQHCSCAVVQLCSQSSAENLPKNWKSSRNLKIFQKSENLPKIWKSSKNLPKIWKSSKNLKIFQKSENLPKIWKSSKNLL